jgi:hypothetical protein
MQCTYGPLNRIDKEVNAMNEAIPRIDVAEAQERWFDLLDLVEKGAKFDISRSGVVVARLEGSEPHRLPASDVSPAPSSEHAT